MNEGNNSEDIDADDQDINDGPLKNETDLLTYQQTFLDESKNVQNLNNFAAKQRRDREEREAEQEDDDPSSNLMELSEHSMNTQ